MTRYEQGFIKRAEELGYDGAALLKSAAGGSSAKRILHRVQKDLTRYWGDLSGKTARKAKAVYDAAGADLTSAQNRWRRVADLFEKRNRQASDLLEKMYDRGRTATNPITGTKLTPLFPKKDVSPLVAGEYRKVSGRIDSIKRHLTRLGKESDEAFKAWQDAGGRYANARNARNAARVNTGVALGAGAGTGGLLNLAFGKKNKDKK